MIMMTNIWGTNGSIVLWIPQVYNLTRKQHFWGKLLNDGCQTVMLHFLCLKDFFLLETNFTVIMLIYCLQQTMANTRLYHEHWPSWKKVWLWLNRPLFIHCSIIFFIFITIFQGSPFFSRHMYLERIVTKQ